MRSSATLVQASGDSTGGRAQIEQIVDVPVPRIHEQIVDVIKVIPEEWMSKRIVQQIVDVPVPHIPKQIVEVILGVVVRLQWHERQHGWTCPQSPEQNVEVIKVILQHVPHVLPHLSASDGIWGTCCSRPVLTLHVG